MAKKFPVKPRRPEKVCWGCSLYCLADDLRCGNGSERIPHPIELDGERWYENGDWSGLLNADQQQELGLNPNSAAPATPQPAPTTPKPRIRLRPSIKKS